MKAVGVRPRSHASLAVSATGKNWYLVNATPDVRHQVGTCALLQPRAGTRESPVRSVLLTDAELDHTIGLLILREGSPLGVYASPAILAALAQEFPVRRILQPYTAFRWIEANTNGEFVLDEDRLRVRAFQLGTKRPRYAAESAISGGWVLGYRFEDRQTRGVMVYAPGIERWSADLAAQVDGTDCVFLDGTFWSDNEIEEAGVGCLTAKTAGHLPISGPGGSAEQFRSISARRRIYVHINNTNPILDDNSPERRLLAESGLEVGWDGMELEI